MCLSPVLPWCPQPFQGNCSVLETTGACTGSRNSYFSPGVLPNELKWLWSKCETPNVCFHLSFPLSNWDMLKYVSHSYSIWIFFLQYPSHTTFIIPTSNFILSFISISVQTSWNVERLYYVECSAMFVHWKNMTLDWMLGRTSWLNWILITSSVPWSPSFANF